MSIRIKINKYKKKSNIRKLETNLWKDQGASIGRYGPGASHLKRAKISQDNRFLSFSLLLTNSRQFRSEPPLSLSSSSRRQCLVTRKS